MTCEDARRRQRALHMALYLKRYRVRPEQIASRLTLTREEAEAQLQKFNEAYPSIREFHEKVRADMAKRKLPGKFEYDTPTGDLCYRSGKTVKKIAEFCDETSAYVGSEEQAREYALVCEKALNETYCANQEQVQRPVQQERKIWYEDVPSSTPGKYELLEVTQHTTGEQTTRVIAAHMEKPDVEKVVDVMNQQLSSWGKQVS